MCTKSVGGYPPTPLTAVCSACFAPLAMCTTRECARASGWGRCARRETKEPPEEAPKAERGREGGREYLRRQEESTEATPLTSAEDEGGQLTSQQVDRLMRGSERE